jgi:tetraacyldisaccharide 4'-kinase
LTRATAVDARRRSEIRSRLERACPGGLPPVWVEATHRPMRLRSASGDTQPLESLATARIAAFAGIGNPAAFRTSLANLGATLVGFRSFPDHHAYTLADLDAIHDWATGLHADLVVTTLKDLVKVRADRLGDLPSGDSSARLETLLEPVVARASPRADLAPPHRPAGKATAV